MPKPPPSPPSSDTSGVDRDREPPAGPAVWDDRARRQLEVENVENVGRPPDGQADGGETKPA